MDSAEDEQDLKLQRASADLLAELQSALRPFLWKKVPSGGTRIRRRVTARETDRLIALLEPFQELPQLLDPHLEKLVPVLADAFLASLRTTSLLTRPKTHTQLLIPLPKAICRLLYTFCKIRGDKVIVWFLSTETRHLELLLSAIEAGSQDRDGLLVTLSHEDADAWSWEERYITLLWLSQLLLAPFDLKSISSEGTATTINTSIPGFSWPQDVPAVALRVIPLSIHYLASAGKERDAAKVLLVRVAMRKDMQELGILHSLVQWALSHLLRSSDVEHSIYRYIGLLSFLAGILISSMSTADMNPYLRDIFQTVQQISAAESGTFKTIWASAVARKSAIKVLRTIAVLVLRNDSTMSSAEMVESTIGHMLEFLADSATPVRLAASKALSIITLNLAPDMASQVVEAVLESFNKNVLWADKNSGNGKYRDLSGVNPLEWHGLVLTLSHLLYRRSPPADCLSDIIPALLTGLSFEQRSTSGSSIGTNVRDAACFGIWALARRYKTDELQTISLKSTSATRTGASSVLQLLATELVVSASLDPAGNIRRGSSAALQELIGRHPNTIVEGIQVVQVVDYHSVALRSRAVQEVASAAAALSQYYMEGLLDALLHWRGVGDGDASARRHTAAIFGSLVWATREGLGRTPWTGFSAIIDRIRAQIEGLKTREVDQRHGLLLCLASVFDPLKHVFNEENITAELAQPTGLKETLSQIIDLVMSILVDAQNTTYRHPELIAEAVSRLLVATYPILRADIAFRAIEARQYGDSIKYSQLNFTKLLNSASTSAYPSSSNQVDAVGDIQDAYQAGIPPNGQFLALSKQLLDNWLFRSESEVIDSASQAAADLITLLEQNDRQTQLLKWISVLSESQGGPNRQHGGFLRAILTAFPIDDSMQDPICQAVLQKWNSSRGIEGRATILQCLARSTALHLNTALFVGMIAEGLDDYTTDARGDIGSLVRVEAVKSVGIIWKTFDTTDKMQLDIFDNLFGRVLRLATEKLDKVRVEAQQVVAYCIRASVAPRFQELSPSSHEYFRFLLEMQTNTCLATGPSNSKWLLDMFEGYVISADTGSEDLVRVSRAALADFCEEGNTDLVCKTMVKLMEKNLDNDRVLISTLEVLSFLFDSEIMQRSSLNWKTLYVLIQRAHYKTGNLRKLEASVKVYGGLAEVHPEALQKLAMMLLHPFPKLRNQVADTLFAVRGVGKGVNWIKARKEDVKSLRDELGSSLI